MSMTFTQLGKTELLKRALHTSEPADLKIGLFTDNETPAFASVLSDFTEATEAGYAQITLDPADFVYTNPATTVIKGQYPKVTFSMTETGTYYGFFVVSGTTLIGAESFSDGPYVLGNAGGDVSVTLSISLD